MLGKESHGLYLLEQLSGFKVASVPANVAGTEVAKVVLLHRRLGHIPFNKLKLLCKLDVSHDCISPCLVYAQARQTRLSFKSSSSHFVASFDLIHIDTWGSFKVDTYDGYKYFITIFIC